MLAFILQGATFGFYAAAQPGPFQAYLMSQSSQDGWRSTLPAAFAPLLSDWPVLFIVLFVLTRVPEGFLQVIQVAGGFFIVYLAYSAFRSIQRDEEPQPQAGAAQQSLIKAATMNLLNPNPWLFWSFAAGPIVAEGWRTGPPRAVAFVLAFYGVFVVLNMAIVVLFGAMGGLDPRIRRGVAFVSAVALLGFGIFQIVSGLGVV